MSRVMISQWQVGVLYENGIFARILPAGIHRLRRGPFDTTRREVRVIDMRERSITIKGQEILTADKVAIRVSLLVYYRIMDPKDALHNVESFGERIYEDVQLAARRFLATRDLDAILNDRNEISDAVRDDVKGAASSYGVEISRADVKDLVFPGNLREIMNQVLETERRAEAELIRTKKDSEALKIRNEVENENVKAKFEAERLRVRTESEAEAERVRLKHQTDQEEAQALRENPELLRLLELQTLQKMAHSGARFIIGLNDQGITSLFRHPEG
jgi:regulator of protease activity HflC (stomatin/prohibitin superfamily)